MMSFWNYIGEFFLFRWLFSKFRKSTTEHGTHTESIGTSIGRDSEYVNRDHNEGISSDGAVTPVGDKLIDDSDNSEDLDDLDRFMRNNNSDNRSCLHHEDYDCDYYSRSRYSGHHDWNSGNDSQSYDDFHVEQDDYDIMDDDF